MSFPFFASLRLNAPSARICALTRPHLRSLFECVSAVDRTLVLDEAKGSRGWRMVLQNAQWLRDQRYDLGFCLPPSFGAAFMFWRGRVRRRVGYRSDGRGVFLTDTLPYGRDGARPHRAEAYLALLDLVWPSAQKARELSFRPGEAAREAVDSIWRTTGLTGYQSVCVVSPGAAQPNKHWAASRFAEVSRRWLAEKGGALVVVGGPSERALCSQVAAAAGEGPVYNLAGVGNLAVTTQIISRCAVFVGNDSGLSHLAAAVGTPTVVISGPGDPAEVAPFSPLADTVKHPLFCSPCYRNTCWRKDHPLECQDLVTVDQVWFAMVESGRKSLATH